ncbi:hypothetical protein [Maliponia aquimaris]|uniref:hypothetical protein n=1 Tax=Maliponia aquimaris TaxID=1673631 RepID=UPI003522EF12
MGRLVQHRHRHSAIGYVASNEAEEDFHKNSSAAEKPAQSSNQHLSGKLGAVQNAFACAFADVVMFWE